MVTIESRKTLERKECAYRRKYRHLLWRIVHLYRPGRSPGPLVFPAASLSPGRSPSGQGSRGRASPLAVRCTWGTTVPLVGNRGPIRSLEPKPGRSISLPKRRCRRPRSRSRSRPGPAPPRPGPALSAPPSPPRGPTVAPRLRPRPPGAVARRRLRNRLRAPGPGWRPF